MTIKKNQLGKLRLELLSAVGEASYDLSITALESLKKENPNLNETDLLIAKIFFRGLLAYADEAREMSPDCLAGPVLPAFRVGDDRDG